MGVRMATATASLTDRERALLLKFRPPELRDLPDEWYGAVVKEAQRIACHEHYRRKVEKAIADAHESIELGIWPLHRWTDAAGYTWRNGRHERTGKPIIKDVLDEHDPVVLCWLLDTVVPRSAAWPFASLDSLYGLAEHHKARVTACTRWNICGALRSWHRGGLVHRAAPRTWGITDLGRELLDVVFDE